MVIQPKEQPIMYCHRLDVTSVTDREEIASAFGPITAWQAAVNNLRLREHRATDPRKKRKLRLDLLNAENQLRLAIEAGQQPKGANDMSEQDLINAVRDHAYANYNDDGWDYVVECWEDGDILEAIGDADTAEEAVARVREAVRPLAEMRDEVRAAGEW
jgi:hypothetical protein